IADLDIPKLGAGEVLVKVKACGVCGTDNALFTGAYPGNYPVVIGHEFSGDVIEIGDGVTKFAPGNRVTVDPNRVCHSCDYCQAGHEHLCERLSSMGVHIQGANAEYCVMPESNIYKIADTLSYEEAAFGEPLACAIHGVDLAGVKVGDTVLIIGAGGMGNLIAQCVASSGAANVIVSEPIALRREKALENGATHVIDPLKHDPAQALKAIKRIGADVVFEVAGNSEAQQASLSYVRKGGTIMFFGCSPQGALIEVNPFIINEHEFNISGSFNNQFATARAVEMLGSKKIRVDNLISDRIPLHDYLEVFKMFGGRETLKLMVTID
ncbi:MAG: zinc-dependent alcohol dehydrogenase family protein, partial [bacterium]|nr:zinc-dependent alcohol dehydrogenase family protein [bacterium]